MLSFVALLNSCIFAGTSLDDTRLDPKNHGQNPSEALHRFFSLATLPTLSLPATSGFGISVNCTSYTTSHLEVTKRKLLLNHSNVIMKFGITASGEKNALQRQNYTASHGRF